VWWPHCCEEITSGGSTECSEDYRVKVGRESAGYCENCRIGCVGERTGCYENCGIKFVGESTGRSE